MALPIGIFPPRIKKIILGAAYNQPLTVGIFPEGIHTIELEKRFSHPLEVGLFPSSVRKLKIFTAHPLPMGIFPEGLESIEFNSAFNQLLLPGIFPSSLRSLEFSHSFGVSSFQQDFLPGVLPEFLCELQLSSYYGFFPLSALPPYFHPDSSSVSSDVPHRLKTPEDSDLHYSMILRLMARIGSDRQFLKKTLRAPVALKHIVSPSSSDQPFSLAIPLDGIGEAFLISDRLLENSSNPTSNWGRKGE